MQKNVYKIAVLSAALILLAAAIYIYRPNQTKFTRITVIGESKARAAPDTALLSFSVVTQSAEAVNAQQENAKKSEAVKTAVEAVTQNIKTEIKTDDYSLNPEEDYSGKVPKIAGYEVKNSLTISVGDLSKVGAVIDAATKAGANSIDGIRFVLDETSPAQGDSLSSATRQAMAKAEAIAKSLNGRVVRVVESQEGGAPLLASSAGEDYRGMSNAMSANTATAKPIYNTPVQAGSLDVRSQVVLVVEVEM